LHYLSRLLTALLEQEEESSPSTYKTLVNIAATLFRSAYFSALPSAVLWNQSRNRNFLPQRNRNWNLNAFSFRFRNRILTRIQHKI
jgi:hypothetical protein